MHESGLTEREVDIMRMYSTGATREKMAKKLKISPQTVSVHKHNIKAKLGIRSEFDLIRWCMNNLENQKELKV